MSRAERFRIAREERHNRIFAAALNMASTVGLVQLTREKLKVEANVAAGSVNAAFGDIEGVRRAVVAHAVQNRLYPIIAQAMALKTYDDLIPVDVRQEAACSLA